MKILGLIPARGGSKGVPKKNIKLLSGKPLLAYTIDAAKPAKQITRLILSSDDDDIINIAKEYDLEVPFKRPLSLAKDDTPTLDVIQHALDFFKKEDEYFDAVCLLQPTSPFKTTQFIDKALVQFMRSGADALISVQKVPDEYNPHWTYKSNADGLLELVTGESKIISRRQELPTTYHRDGIVYITKTDVLMQQNSLYGSKLTYIESPKEFNVNIDTEDDWKLAESHLEALKK